MDGGGTITLEPGLYRLTTMLSFESLAFGRYATLTITTTYPDRGYGPYNPSRVPFDTEIGTQSVSTEATLVLDYATEVTVDVDVLTADGDLMRDVGGWLMIESFGSTFR
ncbi:hypothetical protein [Microcella sp.]|uniref:hypothetical protein n=1 Tax=Microcella sp. TaxID=1913979 RepID=UPI003F7057C1